MMKAVKIEKVHTGEWISMYEITYQDEIGNSKVYEMVSKRGTKRNPEELTLDSIGEYGTAVVMAVFNESMDKLLLCKEFRMGVNQYIYNFPAGLIEVGESIGEAVRRELKEETGLGVIEVLRHLKPSFTCAPVTDDVTDFIILRASGSLLDSTNINEEIHSEWYTKSEVLDLISDTNTMFAGRTQVFCYLWAISNDVNINNI